MDLIVAFSACPQDILPINGRTGRDDRGALHDRVATVPGGSGVGQCLRERGDDVVHVGDYIAHMDHVVTALAKALADP